MQLKTYFAQDASGNIIPNAQVFVYLAGTTTLASGIVDQDGAPLTNPFNADSGAAVVFAAPDGEYDVKCSGASRTVTIRAQLFDGGAFKGDLAAPGGSALVGYDGGTAQDVLDDAKPMANYTALRAYAGRATGVRITQAGLAGFFQRDDADTTSADNGGTIIVDASGRRWKRLFAGRVLAVWFGAKADWNGSTGTDNTGPIQAAIHYAASLSLVGPSVELPVGKLRITGTITTAGAGNVGQVGLVGAGKTATTLCPDGDFTAVNLVTSLIESGDFSVEWPVTAAASIPTTRIGVELASGSYQFSNAVLRNVEVRYGYRGVILNDWTGQPLGTTWLCTLCKVTAFRCADWGFHLNSKNGSTTLKLEQCYVRGDSSAGGQYGKGIYINNVNDISMDQVAVDQCLNDLIYITNCMTADIRSLALESNKVALTTARPVHLAAARVNVAGVKSVVQTFDTGGSALLFFLGATCKLTISGLLSQGDTVAAGTTRYWASYNAVGSELNVLDSSIVQADVLDNGWLLNNVFQGVRYARNGLVPSQGTWVRGQYIRSGAPTIGQPKGWVCTASGSPGTWVSEGNL